MGSVGARRFVVCSRNCCRFTQIIRQNRLTDADLAFRAFTSVAAGTCRLSPNPLVLAVRFQPAVAAAAASAPAEVAAPVEVAEPPAEAPEAVAAPAAVLPPEAQAAQGCAGQGAGPEQPRTAEPAGLYAHHLQASGCPVATSTQRPR